MKYLNEILINWDNNPEEKTNSDDIINISGEDLRIPKYIKCVTPEIYKTYNSKINEIINKIKSDFHKIGLTSEWDDMLNNNHWLSDRIWHIDDHYFNCYKNALKYYNSRGKLILPEDYTNIHVASWYIAIPDVRQPAGAGNGEFVIDDVLLTNTSVWHDYCVSLYDYLYNNDDIIHVRDLEYFNAPNYSAQMFIWKDSVIDDYYFVFAVEKEEYELNYYFTIFIMEYE